jgi:secondary thiamine-phosphate synthase enzyme
MKIYGESIPLQSSRERRALNINSRVKAAVEKSGLRDGVAIVSSLHSDSAVVLMHEECEPRGELDRWLERLDTDTDDRSLGSRDAFSARFHGLLLGQQVIVPFSDSRLDLGPGEAVYFIELAGMRPRRVVVKILGE